MKIKKQCYEDMKFYVSSWDKRRVQQGLPGFMATAALYREEGHSPRRFRGDVLRTAIGSQYVSDVLYPLGLNDDHIDSAMRRICKELTGGDKHWSEQKE